ncbi:hypothetical protein [Paracoccus sp. JM45]|uniref:hypothetical protein n=1 Tax=Paracoccus sp. JM45 TaxID=2283626 RepID=UPI000E6BB84F|nr:hypothetical protein [Paracoccus sp. JM45]RJE81712.1 hypothetical protein DWB67_03605 [Paracoccus sp. JM45]
MVRPRRKPAPLPVTGQSRKGRFGRTARAMAAPQSDAQRLSADIGKTIFSIRQMIDGDPSVLADPAPASPKAEPVIVRLWHAWGDRMLARLQSPPVAAPQPVIVQPDPLLVPTSKDVADMLLGHPDLHMHLQSAVQQELNGELGAKFSANLRAVIRSQIAMAVQDRMIDA